MTALAEPPAGLSSAQGGSWISLERLIPAAALTAMTLLPITEMVSRQWRLPGIPGSTAVVQHLTLWIAFIGAALAARSGQLLSLSANTFLPARWAGRVRICVSAVGAAIAMCLAWAAASFVNAERLGGDRLTAAIPRWVAQSAMPAGFLAVALGIVWHAAPNRRGRLWAALGLCLPLAFGFLPAPHSAVLLAAGIAVILAAALLGLPIFATLGGIALLLFWNAGVPAAAVPVETYRLVASPVLPSIPLFTFAGYLLVAGGANLRLLRVYQALLGWLPGGLAITTAVVCAIFTWAGSGVTILAMGGLLLPMLVRARYPENFSIGLINASGSLGLLFPPSLPVILYGIYSRTPIDSLFVGGFLPGLLMIGLVSAWGVYQGVRNRAERTRFSADEAIQAAWAAKWELAIPVIVLIGLFGGFGTLVEAGAITVAYVFFVECAVYKGLSARRDYAGVARECATVIGGVLLIVGVAVGFTNYLVDAQLPALLIAWTQAHIHSKYAFLLLLNIVLLVKGSFMDVFSAIIVVAPLITPIAAGFGIEPVQLGIIFLANLELGYLTPPVGMNLCLSAYRFQRPMASVYRATLPFYLILLAGVLLITYVPWITMAPVHWFVGR
ncbi:MAG TPA: TRAP transporter large permease subunit [Bryobacteraceae bacterium]|nr:TRAP transporter large permease subunit [Bryobacteraceae bacterium]